MGVVRPMLREVAETYWLASARSRRGGFGTRLGLLLPQDGGSLSLQRLDERASASRFNPAPKR